MTWFTDFVKTATMIVALEVAIRYFRYGLDIQRRSQRETFKMLMPGVSVGFLGVALIMMRRLVFGPVSSSHSDGALAWVLLANLVTIFGGLMCLMPTWLLAGETTWAKILKQVMWRVLFFAAATIAIWFIHRATR